MISRPPRRLRGNARKAKRTKIKALDKGIDNPDRVLLIYPVFKTGREKRRLLAINTLDKSLHAGPRRSYRRIITAIAFPHSQDPELTCTDARPNPTLDGHR